MQNDGEWYWSLTQHKVVRAGEERTENLLGPYATRDEAEGALDHVRARNDALDAEEERELADDLQGLSPEQRQRRLEEERDKRKFGGPFGF